MFSLLKMSINQLTVYLRNLLVIFFVPFRFVFEELVGTKIDNAVAFPLEGLDLSDYISGPKNTTLKYDLQSFVCHFGGK